MHPNMIFGALIAALAAVVLGGTAQAQTAGTYNGTSADGQMVSFTVTTQDGKASITSVGLNTMETCGSGQGTNFTGIGYDPQAAIAKQKAAFTENFGTSYQMVSGTFSGSSFNGSIYTSNAILYNSKGGKVPNKAAICISARQSFTTTLNAPAAIQRRTIATSRLLSGRP